MKSMFDAVLKNIGGAPDNIDGLASKVGLDPKMVEKALASLTQTFSAPEDTVDAAAKQTGIAKDQLAKVMQQLGGENALGQIASQFGNSTKGLQDLLGGKTPDLGGIADMAKGFFGKK